MEKIEISPSTQMIFRIPSSLKQTFNVSNLTIRPIAISIFASHHHELSIEPSQFTLESFQEQSVSVTLHYSQDVKNTAAAKLRVYIWQIFEEYSASQIRKKMFQDEQELAYNDMTIDMTLDESVKLIQNKSQHNHNISTEYFIRQILPSLSQQIPAEEPKSPSGLPYKIKNKVIQFTQTLGNVKGIFTFGNQYVAEFQNMFKKEEVQEQTQNQKDQGRCQFYQEWFEGVLYTFAIGRIVTYGKNLIVPNLVILGYGDAYRDSEEQRNKQHQKDTSKISSRQEKITGVFINVENTAQQFPLIEEEKQMQAQQMKNLQQQPDQDTSQIKINSKKSLDKSQTKVTDLTHQSFMVSHLPNRRPNHGKGHKRNKSEQLLTHQQFEESNPIDFAQEFDINQLQALQKNREGKDFQCKLPQSKAIKEQQIELTRTILNVRCFESYLFILLSDCLIFYNLEEEGFQNKTTVKFEKIDEQDIKECNPMQLINNELIFANDSYLYWVNLRKKTLDWKYVQRKEIKALVGIPELSLLVVGGRNFSKLAYLGKNTSRTNIKFYSCAAADKHNHLHTYDLPSNQGGIVQQLAYIETSPNKNRLLVVFTHNNWLYFFRVKAFDNIEIYSQIDIREIGIQSIKELQWNPSCGLCCLEQLEEMHCLKRIKVKCQYEKVEMATETLKIPVGRYNNIKLTSTLSKKDDKKMEIYPQQTTAKEGSDGYVAVTSTDRKTMVISNSDGKNIRQLSITLKGLRGAMLSENHKWVIAYGQTTIKIRQWTDK